MGFTNSGAISILTSKLGTCVLDLYTSAPSDAGTPGTKPSTAYGYSSVSIQLKQTTGAEKQIQNHDLIQFPICRQDWGTITHFGLSNSGSLIFWDALDNPVAITTDTIAVFDIGSLIIGLDKAALDPANPTKPTFE